MYSSSFNIGNRPDIRQADLITSDALLSDALPAATGLPHPAVPVCHFLPPPGACWRTPGFRPAVLQALAVTLESVIWRVPDSPAAHPEPTGSSPDYSPSGSSKPDAPRRHRAPYGKRFA